MLVPLEDAEYAAQQKPTFITDCRARRQLAGPAARSTISPILSAVDHGGGGASNRSSTAPPGDRQGSGIAANLTRLRKTVETPSIRVATERFQAQNCSGDPVGIG